VHLHLYATLHVNDRETTPDSAACACGRLRRATRALTQLYDDAMAPAGLRVTQFSLLRTLASTGALRMNALAARLLLIIMLGFYAGGGAIAVLFYGFFAGWYVIVQMGEIF